MPSINQIRTTVFASRFPGEIADIIEDQMPAELAIYSAPETYYITRYEVQEGKEQEFADYLREHTQDKEETIRFLEELESSGWSMTVIVDCD